MELRHLRYFEAVAREGNFTRAAEALGIAQPPLSRQIRDLENELGAQLIDREARPVRLTQAGKLLHEQAARILSSVDQLKASMRLLTSAQNRRFVIGVVGSIMQGSLPDIIRAFRHQATNVDVELTELTTLEQVAALKAGRIDAGLGRVRIEDPAIERAVLYHEPLMAALPANHPLAATRGPLALAQLGGQRLILYPSQPRPSYADQLLTLLGDHGVEADRVIEVREVQTALGLVAAQEGCAIVPVSLRHVQRDDVVYRPIAEDSAVSPIILSRPINSTDRCGDLFAQIARETYRKIPA